MPPVSVPLHVSCNQSSEGISFLGSDIDGDGDVPQVGPVSIFLPPLSPKVCRVPGMKATQLDWRSRGGTTSGGSCSTSLMQSWLAPLSLLKSSSSSQARLTPSMWQSLWVLTWSLFIFLWNSSLILGREPSSMAYSGNLVLQLLWFPLHHLQDGASPDPSGVGGEDRSLYLLLVWSPRFILWSYQALLPDQSLPSGEGGCLAGSTEGYPTPDRGGWLTPLIQVWGAWLNVRASE